MVRTRKAQARRELYRDIGAAAGHIARVTGLQKRQTETGDYWRAYADYWWRQAEAMKLANRMPLHICKYRRSLYNA